MQEPQPPPLDYRGPRPPDGPGRPDPGRRVLWQLLLGLGLGTAFSAVVWVGGWNALVEHGSGYAMIVVPTVKVVAGGVLLGIRGRRAVGGGILLSLALGFLIFFGTCAANLKI